MSFVIMVPTRKCLPIPRRKSMALSGRGPVQVVDHPGGVVALEAEEALDLGLQFADPFGDGLRGVQDAFGRLPRITDQARGTAHQPEGLVAGQLDAGA